MQQEATTMPTSSKNVNFVHFFFRTSFSLCGHQLVFCCILHTNHWALWTSFKFYLIKTSLKYNTRPLHQSFEGTLLVLAVVEIHTLLRRGVGVWETPIIINIFNCHPYSRSFATNQWYCFNDQSVTRVSSGWLVSQETWSNIKILCHKILLLKKTHERDHWGFLQILITIIAIAIDKCSN